MTEASGSHVLREARAGVGTVTLNRPERMNAVAGTMRSDLRDAISALSGDDTVRVIVVRGAGRAFCAGADVDAMAELHDRGDEEAFAAHLRTGMEVVRAVHAAPKPVVCALNGPAAGAGAALAVACDLRIAGESAKIGFTFNRIGLHPDWGSTYHLPRLVGPGRAAELMYSARMVSTDEAARIGLVEQLVPDGELDGAVGRLAESLAAKPPLALEALRATLNRGTERPLTEAMEAEAEAQLRLFRSPDLAEGIRAFREKRPPRFGSTAGAA